MKTINQFLLESLFDEGTFEYKISKWFERDPEGLTRFNDYVQQVKSKHFIDKNQMKNFYMSLQSAPQMIDFICDNTDLEDNQRDYLDTFYNIIKFSANV